MKAIRFVLLLFLSIQLISCTPKIENAPSPTISNTIATRTQPTLPATPTRPLPTSTITQSPVPTSTITPTTTPAPTQTSTPIPVATHDPIFDQNPVMIVPARPKKIPQELETLFRADGQRFAFISPEQAAVNEENAKLGRKTVEYTYYDEASLSAKLSQVTLVDFDSVEPAGSCNAEQTVKLAIAGTYWSPVASSLSYDNLGYGVEELDFRVTTTTELKQVQVNGDTLTAVKFIYMLPGFEIRKGWLATKAELADGTVINFLKSDVGEQYPEPENVFAKPSYGNHFTWLIAGRRGTLVQWDNPQTTCTAYNAHYGRYGMMDCGIFERTYAWQQQFDKETGNASQLFLAGEQIPEDFVFVPSFQFIYVMTEDGPLPNEFMEQAINLDIEEVVECATR